MSKQMLYSKKWCGVDEQTVYRTVMMPGNKRVHKLLSEKEWRSWGIQMSLGWIHILNWEDGLVLLFKKPRDPTELCE